MCRKASAANLHIRVYVVCWSLSQALRCGTSTQETEDGGLELAALLEAKGTGAPALHLHAYEYDPEDFGLELGKDVDLDLLPAPDFYFRNSSDDKSLSRPAFGHAVTAIKGWWTEEFTFRGFGIGLVKPVFRGVLLRPDIGVGIRCEMNL